MKQPAQPTGTVGRWHIAAARVRDLFGLLGRAAARRPLALLLDMAMAITQGALTGASVAALGSLLNRRDLSALALWGAALVAGVVATGVRPLLSRRAQQGLREALGEELLQATVRLPFEDFSRREVRTHLDRAADVLQGDRVYHLLQHVLNVLAECSRLGAVAVPLGAVRWERRGPLRRGARQGTRLVEREAWARRPPSQVHAGVPVDLGEKVLNGRDLLDRWLPPERARWVV